MWLYHPLDKRAVRRQSSKEVKMHQVLVKNIACLVKTQIFRVPTPYIPYYFQVCKFHTLKVVACT